ncbi:MAG TPA: sensor histidine kinase [Alphaproteobacteria bacterium]|nr:sensor histidine kinase [Alphaproteobacteria bacterium]
MDLSTKGRRTRQADAGRFGPAGFVEYRPVGAPPQREAAAALSGYRDLQRENEALRRLVTRLQAEIAELRAAAPAAARPVEAADGDMLNAVRELGEALRHQDMLLREADHRVKNNLMGIVLQLHVQAQRQADPQAAEALRLACARVQAAQALHGMLHAHGPGGPVDFGRHIHQICAALGDVLGIDGRHRRLTVESVPAELPFRTAQALAVLTSELVTNAARHAFAPDAPGAVQVALARTAEGGLRFAVSDDGRGLPGDYRPGDGSGLGHRMLLQVADQLGATLEIERGAGTRIALILPDQD